MNTLKYIEYYYSQIVTAYVEKTAQLQADNDALTKENKTLKNDLKSLQAKITDKKEA